MRITGIIKQLVAKQSDVKGKAMLLTGSILFPMQTRRWLQFLAQNPNLMELAQSNPHLVYKIYRPFLSKNINCEGRVSALITHYQIISDAGLGDFVHLAKNICEFTGKSGVAYQLKIIKAENREGELSLLLESEGAQLYRVSFVLCELDGEICIKVGCVQGLRGSNAAERVKSLTKDFHACRPKTLILSVARDIGDYFGCKRLIGVSNETRILANRSSNDHQPDYDQTWEELGGARRQDGEYELSCTGFLKTTFDDIPSNKRSEAKKRNALLGSICQSVRVNLNKERSGDSDQRKIHAKNTI